MPVDWAARLDDRGYHVVPAKRHAVAARWDCETEKVSDESGVWVEGDAIIVYDPQGNEELRVKVGDVIYLSGVQKGKPAELVRIDTNFWTDEEGSDGFFFFGTFFWRPERLKLKDEEWERKELFLQSTQEPLIQPIIYTELVRVTVTDAASFEDGPHKFFSRRTWDLMAGEASPLPQPEEPVVPEEAAEPMDAEDTAEAPGTERPPAKKAPRRNVAAEREADRARIADLEAQVSALTAKLSEMDTLAATVRALEVKLESLEATE